MPFQSSWLQQATLYRYRYVVGYALLAVLLVSVLVIDIDALPAGINQSEMSSAVTSARFGSPTQLDWVVNAPYHLLQFGLLWLLGVSKLSLVIPSLAFGGLTIILLTLTLRHWFKPNIAIIASIVAVTNTAFINMARSGTPEIMLSFWTILLLYAAVRFLIKRDKTFFWKLVMVVSAVALLYTPFGIYPLTTLLVCALVHPHTRSRLRRIKINRLAVLVMLALLAITPLIYALIKQPHLIKSLTGVHVFAGAFSHPIDNLRTLFDYYANFLHARLEGSRILPTFSIVTIILAILGLFQAIRERYTARSYALLSWCAVAVGVIILAPREQSVILMPVLLLLAIGIQTLISDWYLLFPRNPYARIAGLIPLAVLFIGAGYNNLNLYFSTMRYNTNQTYSYSLPAVKQALLTEGDRPVRLLVRPEEKEFYRLIQHSYPKLSVLTTPETSDVNYVTLVLPGAANPYSNKIPSEIITTYTMNNGAVLRAYRP